MFSALGVPFCLILPVIVSGESILVINGEFQAVSMVLNVEEVEEVEFGIINDRMLLLY